MEIPDIGHKDPHSDFKKPIPTGNLAGRDVVVEEPTFWNQPWKWLTELIKNACPFQLVTEYEAPSPPSSPRLPSSHIQLNLDAIERETATCIQELSKPYTTPKTAIHYWLLDIYEAHGCNPFPKCQEWSQEELQRLWQIDKILNPVLLEKIKEFFPHSSEA